MTLITRSVHNPRSIPCPIRVPGYDATLPLIVVASHTTLDLLTVMTEDQLVGVQESLAVFVAGGALTVTDTIDTSSFEQGYTGSSVWGNITGTLSNQTDLQTALNGKENAGIDLRLAGGTMVGDIDMANHNISNVGLNTANLVGDLEGNNHTINDIGLNNVLLKSNLDAQNFKVVNLTDPSSAQEAATKNYVDTGLATKLSLTGGTVTGTLTLSKAPVLPTTTYTASTASPFTPVATNTNVVVITVDANLTLNGPSSPYDGQKILFEFLNDASHVVTLATGSGNFAFGTDITSYTAATSKADLLGAVWSATANRWYVVSLIQGF